MRWLLAIVLAFGVCASSGWAQSESAGVPETELAAALALERALVETIEACEKSVVAIARVRKGDGRQGRLEEGFPGAPPSATDPNFVPNEYATGVVIDSNGLILTTHHVIGNPEENDYYVWLQRAPYKAVLVEATKAADPWMDLAVLKIDAADLQPIKFGDAATLRKGQIVVALGNPFAIARDGQASASWGIVSNLARKAPPAEPVEAGGGGETLHHYGTLIQTDAKLNFGTSGGALINLKGEMVGLITSLTASVAYPSPAGFAIPVDEHFKRAVEVLKTGRRADYGFLGVLPWALTREERQRGMRGARVRDVVPGTPASRADVRPGDVILAVNDVPIHDDSDLIRHVSAMLVETPIELTLERNRQLLTRRAVLSKKQLQTRRRAYWQVPDPRWRGLQVDYATAMPAFYQLSRLLDPQGCVGVVDVEENSPAWKAGIRPGDFVCRVEREAVATPAEFFAAAERHPGDVTLAVVRNGDAEPRRVPAE